jgi:subtilisin family serine protease
MKNLGLIRVAVLDDGVDLDHVDLRDTVVARFDAFESQGRTFPLPHDRHGTGCAGLAVADPLTDGMKGVGFGAKLLAARISFTAGAGGSPLMSNSTIRRGIEWAVEQHADVLCMSWSTSPSVAVTLAIRSAVRSGRGGRGCVIVAAAGNDGGSVAFPATLDEVIAVAAVDENLRLRRGSDWSSNFGPEVDITAPGTLSFTTAPNLAYQCLDGTSAAAAIVAGAAALILRVNPGLQAKEVRDLLIATSDVEPAGPGAPGSTIKLLDLEEAIAKASE